MNRYSDHIDIRAPHGKQAYACGDIRGPQNHTQLNCPDPLNQNLKPKHQHLLMAYAVAWIAILFLSRPLIARSNLLSPLLSPVFDDVCEKVECGKGTCKPSDNSTWFYECECNPGWTQTRFDQDDHLQFLPCVVPNCTVNFSCTAAPSPVQEKASKDSQSIFDPCFWADCGGGSCNKTSQFTYSCACAEGYNNLLNVSTFPCYKDCAIGMDCSNLGIMMSNKPAAPTPVMAGNGMNQASSVLQEKSLWLVALMMLLAMIE
uniref:EGF-like domain-containing protein n=1 Tax=Salix viminalis TaxID=40686 RepID=A0A6N2NLB5_SALVM